jgi:hypothetical protein
MAARSATGVRVGWNGRKLQPGRVLCGAWCIHSQQLGCDADEAWRGFRVQWEGPARKSACTSGNFARPDADGIYEGEG